MGPKGTWLVMAIQSRKAIVTGTPSTKERPGVFSKRVAALVATLGSSKFRATNKAGKLSKMPINVNTTMYTSVMVVISCSNTVLIAKAPHKQKTITI
jgi:hypothetical protein